MQGLLSLIGAFGLILIFLGLADWTLFGLPTLPLGGILLIGSFVVGWLFSDERK